LSHGRDSFGKTDDLTGKYFDASNASIGNFDGKSQTTKSYFEYAYSCGTTSFDIAAAGDFETGCTGEYG